MSPDVRSHPRGCNFLSMDLFEICLTQKITHHNQIFIIIYDELCLKSELAFIFHCATEVINAKQLTKVFVAKRQ